MTITESAGTALEPGHFNGKFTVVESLAKGGITGDINGWITQEIDDGIVGARCLIRNDQPFTVRLHWKIHGQLVKYICGKWCCTLHFESIGTGIEFDLPPGPDHKPQPLHNNEQHFVGCVEYEKNDGWAHFWCDIEVEGDTIPDPHCGKPYLVRATVQYLTDCDTPAHPSPGPMFGTVKLDELVFFAPL
jgi:hypothetical protein